MGDPEPERNAAVVEALVAAINAHDWERLDHLVAPAFVRHSHATVTPAVRSRDDFKRFLQGELDAFPDARETIADMVAQRERVAVRHHFEGTQTGPLGPYPPSGRRLAAEYLAIYRLAEGLIVEAWGEWDNWPASPRSATIRRPYDAGQGHGGFFGNYVGVRDGTAVQRPPRRATGRRALHPAPPAARRCAASGRSRRRRSGRIRRTRARPEAGP
jgi:predicted ester cyclase